MGVAIDMCSHDVFQLAAAAVIDDVPMDTLLSAQPIRFPMPCCTGQLFDDSHIKKQRYLHPFMFHI